MIERVHRIPGSDHPITLTKNPHRVRVSFNGTVIAETHNATTLTEASYPPVQYIPREDVNPRFLERSAHTTYCPYKGDASYFHLKTPDASSDNAIWTYETPFEAVSAIKNYVAFCPDRVQISEEDV